MRTLTVVWALLFVGLNAFVYLAMTQVKVHIPISERVGCETGPIKNVPRGARRCRAGRIISQPNRSRKALGIT